MKRNSPIKGLILYEIYTAKGNLSLMLVCSLLMGLLLLATGNIQLLQLFVGVSITLITSVFMLNTARHSTSRWDRFQLALPVKRKEVIDSQYISHLLILAASTMFAVAFTAVNEILHENFFATKRILVWAYSFSIGTSLAGCGLFHPFSCMIGRKNDEALYVASLLGAAVVNGFIVWIGPKVGFTIYTIALLNIVVSAVLFVASYVVTLKIYAKKDL